jgi:hypothetical protein
MCKSGTSTSAIKKREVQQTRKDVISREFMVDNRKQIVDNRQ